MISCNINYTNLIFYILLTAYISNKKIIPESLFPMLYFQPASSCWTMCPQEDFYIFHTNADLVCTIL